MGDFVMKQAVLCGHTGSYNHGCEAIIRSTADILGMNNINVSVASSAIEQDEKYGLDKLYRFIEYRSYNSKFSPIRMYNGMMKKLFKNEYPEQRYVQKDVFRAVKQSDAAIVVGGDTYCYNRSACVIPYNVNKYANKIGHPSILWSCSVGKENIDKEMADDLSKYTMIFPRETETYNNLLSAGINKDKLFLMADSAFVLGMQAIDLPDDFRNVFAYNPSYTLKKTKGINVLELEKSRIELLNYILERTDMKVALIPHVYNGEYGDIEPCREIYKELKAKDRVFVISKDYNCMQLKYIISKCRFLIAERTHASIAGYSTCVPTFVVGYSVKARGIARDIFGSYSKYVLSVREITNVKYLIDNISYIIENESDIKNHLKAFMPGYMESALNAGKMIAELI